MPARPTLVAAASASAAALLWGTAGVISAPLGAAGLSPFAIAAARLSVAASAAPLMLAMSARASRGGEPATVPRSAVVTTGLLLALYQAAYFGAIDRVGVTVATLITLGSAPFLVALFGWVVGDPRPGARQWAGIATSVIGVALLADVDAVGGAAPLVGGALALLSAAGYSAMTLLGRTFGGAQPLGVVAKAIPIGALALSPAIPGVLGADLGAGHLLSLAFLGLVPTAVAYTLFFRAAGTLPAATVSTITLLEPVTAALLAAVVLQESVGVSGLLGGALVMSGVAVVTVRSRP